MEVSQITYFQSVAGEELKPVTGEITYGTERLAMYLQKKDYFYELDWTPQITYGDIYKRNEFEFTTYNLEKLIQRCGLDTLTITREKRNIY